MPFIYAEPVLLRHFANIIEANFKSVLALLSKLSDFNVRHSALFCSPPPPIFFWKLVKIL